MSSIRKQKGGFRLKAGRRQTHFIRGKNLKECLLKYCQRTGADPEEFDDSLSEIFGDLEVKPKQPDLPEDPEGEPGGEELPQGDGEEIPVENTEVVVIPVDEGEAPETPVPEPETVEEVVAELEEAGEEIPTLEVKREE